MQQWKHGTPNDAAHSSHEAALDSKTAINETKRLQLGSEY